MPVFERQTFQNKDLILEVSHNYNPKTYDPYKYEAFLDALCSDREYQKEAIRETIRYFIGGEYNSLRALAEENFLKNQKLREKYSSMNDFVSNLQLPNKLSCSIDHATATGKSYVMYGIARIMLAEGAVDQVLVLCPSNTIETGLTDKFKTLSADRILIDLLPETSEILNPGITNASKTIKKGDICIENIHATYINTKSAIEDSLLGKGNRTLVLNDEAHHMMNPSDTALKKWKEFLIDPKYGFRFIVNLSGTCYVGNDYFTDVIHRFSLRDSIEAGFVKSIRYVAEDSSSNEDEKFQKIYDNHIENKTLKYRNVKPLTILITKNIASCKRLADKLITFLAEKENINKEAASAKVLIVTSAAEHKNNIRVLGMVDDKDCPTEWITSVSMLSEGWDVKNVFQIVPHEERAFNSKLLIAQVLGRGLRIPDVYKGSQPVVTVFNHDRWSSSIKHLVAEILEIEKRIHSYPIQKNENYNFKLHHIKYKRVEEAREYPQEDPYELLSKGYISYSSQAKEVQKQTIYANAISGEQDFKKTLIELKTYSVDEAANQVANKLRVIDMDLDTDYSQEFNIEKIEAIIRDSLKKIGDNEEFVSESNLQRTLQAFGVVYRKKAKSLRFRIESYEVYELLTDKMNKVSMGVGSLRRDGTVFWDSYSKSSGEELDKRFLEELINDESLPRSALDEVANKYNFKTPLNVALAAFEPERKFIRGLTIEENAKAIDSWVKSPNTAFYSIDYSWRKGEHPKQGSFNPDFFIKVGNDILVVEIKMDNDVSDENKAKLKYSRDHFNRLNKLQNQQTYHLKFLSPNSYELFFDAIRNGTYNRFKSELETKLDQ